MSTLLLDLPDELDAQLTEVARLQGVSKTEIVYEAIKQYLAQLQLHPDLSTNKNHMQGFNE